MKLYHTIHFPGIHNFHNPMAQIQWIKLDIVMEFYALIAYWTQFDGRICTYVLEIIRTNGILEAADHIVLLKLIKIYACVWHTTIAQ